MTAFSRLQLAAALIEYDNDPDDPTSSRSAQNSAIFAHIRTRNAPRARKLSGFEHLRETPNLLGVELPNSDAGSARGSMAARRSLAGTRNSKGSIDVLRNPFSEDLPESDQGAEDKASGGEELDIDLESWGMVDFLGKEKEKQRSKNRRSEPRSRKASRAQSEVLPNTRSPIMNEFGQFQGLRHRSPGTRSKSIGGLGTGDEFLRDIRGAPVASEADFRRRSIGFPLEYAGRNAPDFEGPSSSVALVQPLFNNEQQHSLGSLGRDAVPFPSSSPVPGEEEEGESNAFAVPLKSPISRFDPKSANHARKISTESLGSRVILEQGRTRTPSVGPAVIDESLLTFRPSLVRNTRIDAQDVLIECPTVSSSREETTITTMGTPGYLDDNPFSLPPPSPTRLSRFDPKVAAHARTISTASFGSRLPAEGDRTSVASGQLLEPDVRQSRCYSRMELMRPKVLVMPSPLQGSDEEPPAPQVPPGFHMSTVGPPLPPGALSAGRPISRSILSMDNLQVPVTSDSFTPNPRTIMSLSQLTFRNSLMVGGQRDVAYEDIESGLRRAREDGEQIYQEEDIEEEVAEEQKQAQGRAPGKLYGRSLMDELQARKDQMRAKQRVFTGDQRPSMMSRGQIRRSGTLIDPAALEDRPPSQNFGDRPSVNRRGSYGPKPLLDFSGELPRSPAHNVPNSRSVFGVDQLWERELARLKQIEAAEKEEEEERKRIEEEKSARKAKGKGREAPKLPEPSTIEGVPRPSIVSVLPPTLPVIENTTARRARRPIANHDDSDSDSEASENVAKAKAAAHQGYKVDGWESSDEEGPSKLSRKIESESEDDVPLVRQIPVIRPPSVDSEDEKPLAKVLERKSMLNINFDSMLDRKVEQIDDDDDAPLAVRHPQARSTIAQSITHGDDDDEKPLGLQKAEQHQHQMQYNMMVQQQMIVEAQLRQSMAFGTPSALSGFSPFMIPPPAFNTLPPPMPLADPGKYQSVDRWRRNVATE